MRVGSIVETVADFEQLRRVWNLPYPKKGDVLTVSAITRHPNPEVNKRGIVFLHFEELPGLTGLCNKTIYNKPNFLELTLPDEIMELLEQPIEEVEILELELSELDDKYKEFIEKAI
jgi:hypothetical protein